MDRMIHYESAEDGDLGHREHGSSTTQQGPRLHKAVVACSLKRRARRDDVLVEHIKRLLQGLRVEGLRWRRSDRRYIMTGFANRDSCPHRNFGEMAGEPAHGHRFLMGLPAKLVF